MINKETLHRLVEELPDGELPTALKFLQYLKDTGDADEIPRDPYPYARASMRDDGEYDGGAELVEALPEDDESVADAWRKYLDSKPRYSDFGF